MIRFCLSIYMLSLLFCTAVPAAADPGESAPRVQARLQDGICTLDAHEIVLKYVLNAISDECGVTVTGLETRRSESLTIPELRGTPEYVVRQVLHLLKENNFLLQYEEDELTKVAVLSASKGSASSPPTKQPPARPKMAPGSPGEPPFPFMQRSPVVAVRGIVSESQAEKLGLKKGDIILEYDGVRIKSASQLIKNVKDKSPEETVEMIVVREGRAETYKLNGGLIGVELDTIIVAFEKLGGRASEGKPQPPGPTAPILKTF